MVIYEANVSFVTHVFFSFRFTPVKLMCKGDAERTNHLVFAKFQKGMCQRTMIKDASLLNSQFGCEVRMVKADVTQIKQRIEVYGKLAMNYSPVIFQVKIFFFIFWENFS